MSIPLFFATVLFSALVACGIFLPLVEWRVLTGRGITASFSPSVRPLCDIILMLALWGAYLGLVVFLYSGSVLLYSIRGTASGDAMHSASVLLFAPSLSYQFADGSSILVQRRQKDKAIIINDSEQPLKLSHHQYYTPSSPIYLNALLESPVIILPHEVYHAAHDIHFFGSEQAPEAVNLDHWAERADRYSLEYRSSTSEKSTSITSLNPMVLGATLAYLVWLGSIRHIKKKTYA